MNKKTNRKYFVNSFKVSYNEFVKELTYNLYLQSQKGYRDRINSNFVDLVDEALEDTTSETVVNGVVFKVFEEDVN